MADIQLTLRTIGIGVVTERRGVAQVLLPASGAAAGGHRHARGAHVAEHVARLYFGRAFEHRGAPPPSIAVDNCVVRIVDRTSRRPRTPRVEELISIRDAIGDAPFVPEVFAPSPPPELLRGRVELHLSATPHPKVEARYELRDRRARRATPFEAKTLTEWTARIPSGELEIQVIPYPFTGRPRPITIVPPVQKGAVHLDFLHVPPEDLPPNVARSAQHGEEIEHFPLYYRLFGMNSGPKLFFVGDRGGSSVRCPKASAY